MDETFSAGADEKKRNDKSKFGICNNIRNEIQSTNQNPDESKRDAKRKIQNEKITLKTIYRIAVSGRCHFWFTKSEKKKSNAEKEFRVSWHIFGWWIVQNANDNMNATMKARTYTCERFSIYCLCYCGVFTSYNNLWSCEEHRLHLENVWQQNIQPNQLWCACDLWWY